jgi:hypothetical protein
MIATKARKIIVARAWAAGAYLFLILGMVVVVRVIRVTLPRPDAEWLVGAIVLTLSIFANRFHETFSRAFGEPLARSKLTRFEIMGVLLVVAVLAGFYLGYHAE